MRRFTFFLFLSATVLFRPTDGESQGINGRARTYVSYLEIRELVLDLSLIHI